uniref:thioredoxin-dependent peroxiredoxin n=1 Tax=Mola mola TaxID=94237 RepID=A0A3Q3VQ48_MOLML
TGVVQRPTEPLLLTPLCCCLIKTSLDLACNQTNTPRKQGGLGTMKIPLVSDTRHTISTDYGVLKEDEGIAYRGLFIIDPKGILRQITINDLPVGRSVEETLRLVQAFQFTDKHGEVCPAGWKPGSDTIKPDVQKSKEFFSKN